MTEKRIPEAFRYYGDAEQRAEHRGVEVGQAEPVPCTVSHPDAGGQCPREAVGEVWGLPFCEVHGIEAGIAYEVDQIETVSYGLDKLKDDGDNVLHPAISRLIGTIEHPTRDIFNEEFEDVIREAYPPEELEGNIDQDTLRFDYEKRDYGPGPYDWWCDAHYQVLRFMREVYDAGYYELLVELELVRERVTVQRILAHRDMDQRWAAPQREAREEAVKS